MCTYNLMHKEWRPFPAGRVPDWEAGDLILDLALSIMGRVTLSRSLSLFGPHLSISPFLPRIVSQHSSQSDPLKMPFLCSHPPMVSHVCRSRHHSSQMIFTSSQKASEQRCPVELSAMIECSRSAIFNMITTSRMWLLSTWSVASVAEKLICSWIFN